MKKLKDLIAMPGIRRIYGEGQPAWLGTIFLEDGLVDVRVLPSKSRSPLSEIETLVVNHKANCLRARRTNLDYHQIVELITNYVPVVFVNRRPREESEDDPPTIPTSPEDEIEGTPWHWVFANSPTYVVVRSGPSMMTQPMRQVIELDTTPQTTGTVQATEDQALASESQVGNDDQMNKD